MVKNGAANAENYREVLIALHNLILSYKLGTVFVRASLLRRHLRRSINSKTVSLVLSRLQAAGYLVSFGFLSRVNTYTASQHLIDLARKYDADSFASALLPFMVPRSARRIRVTKARHA